MAQTYRSTEILRNQNSGWAATAVVVAGAASAGAYAVVSGSAWVLLLAAAFAGGVLCGRQLTGLGGTFGVWRQTKLARKAQRLNRRGGSRFG